VKDLHDEGKVQQEEGVEYQVSKFRNHPCDTASWYEAMAFCRWLTARFAGAGLISPGSEIRLPTEEQWEAAARGPEGLVYPWGNEYIPGYANIDEMKNIGGLYYTRQTTAVGMYPQGAAWCGALDMSGNVWEWTLTEYQSKDSTNIGSNASRVVRGGSWGSSQFDARAAYRSRYYPANRGGGLCGFRVVGVIGVRAPSLA